MTGLENGIFPREDKKDEELEEERRLFYVGVTRAMDELYLTSCMMRRMYGKISPMQPSLFLHEIDAGCLKINSIASGFETGKPMARQTFNPYYFDKELEDRAGWKRGQRLFHENYGYGAVMEVQDSEDGPVVRVRFDNGKETRFLSEYQGRAFEKMGADY